MKARLFLIAAAAFAWPLAFGESDADGAWRWRRQGGRPASTSSYQAAIRNRPSSNFKYYSGISRAEYDLQRRYDAWYDHAYNGFRPSDFR